MRPFFILTAGIVAACLAPLAAPAAGGTLPSGLQLLAQDDLGNPGRQSNLAAGKNWQVVDPSATEAIKSDPRYANLAYDEQAVIWRYADLDPKARYWLRVFYLSSDEHRRSQALMAGNQQLHAPMDLPQGRPVALVFELPPASYRQGAVQIAVRNLQGVNAVVSAAELWTDQDLEKVRAQRAQATAAAIRELTGAPTRIVWAQEMGEGYDTGIVGNNFRLMGFDTEDGRGERPILAALTNYARPLITPRGNRVIFSNRQSSAMFIVNWDGTGLRQLGATFALAVWLDPATGIEWVYSGRHVDTDHPAALPIRRAPIDQPERDEIIWKQTPVDYWISNFQLSADGRRASGAFPWPNCGIADLPDGGWKKYGDGCWPALAPDNSGLFWVLDGSHKNLRLFRTDTNAQWRVVISQAPGVDNHEVFHPRWSNHVRFMVLTGPYKRYNPAGGRGNNWIRGGGPEVEIQLGRFDDQFRAIESWVRVTRNAQADFHPDVWIRPAGAAQEPAG